MLKTSSQGSRIEEVLNDATTDLKNAKLPDFVGKILVPVTTKAAKFVPAAASAIPLPFVDRVGAFVLSVPLNAMKLGYSILPHADLEKDQQNQLRTVMQQTAGIDLVSEMQESNLQEIPSEKDRINTFQDQELSFLVEIVGCENLVTDDLKSTINPYVRIKFRNKILHNTKHQLKTSNPIYTLRKNGFFLFTTSVRELFLGDINVGVQGLMLEVCDFNSKGSDDVLSTALVPPKDIYNAKEERLIYPLPLFLEEQQENVQGSIAVRIRRATGYDKEFLSAYEEYEKRNETTGVPQKNNHQKGKKKRGEYGSGTLKSMLEKKVKTFVENGKKIEKYKVLPFPDPELVTGTDSSTDDSNHADTDSFCSGDPIWKTASEIENITMQPSRHYLYIGSGNIARVYLEILACNNLPNKDIPLFGRKKSDPFVQVVYEDCICRTDVVDDKNNPRFLPYTNRSFVLHSHFPSSVINLGVFDHDRGTNHDFIGRASVDLSSLRPRTEYILDYKLYDTALFETRNDNGTIRIRVRMEVDNPRAYLLAGLSLPPPRYVNCSTYKEFKCVHKTCYGGNDMNRYSIVTVLELVAELLDYKRFYYYAAYALRSQFLWRGSHHVVTISKKKIYVPLNSCYAFAMAVTLIEKPYLLPSFLFLTFALVLMSSMRWRNDHPNPWWRCHKFTDLAKVLFLGKYTSLSSETIAEEERANEAKMFDLTWNQLIDAAEKKAEAKAKERAEIGEALNQELEAIGGGDIEMSTLLLRSKIHSLRVSKKFVFPIQQVLLETCKWFRFAKNVFLWEEPLSFWLALGFLCLSVVFVKLEVVRRSIWVIGWAVRIVTWTLFGPWMKLVGWYVLRTDFGCEESKVVKEEAVRLERQKDNEKTLEETRVKNELAFKLRDFRQYFYGKFLTKVHILKFDRYIDTPLSSSSARPWQEASHMDPSYRNILEVKPRTRKTGQELLGLMIPNQRDVVPDIDKTEVDD